MLSAKANFVPNSLNEENRTVRAVITSALPCDRMSWEHGLYKEILSMDSAHIRLERVKTNAAPVLNNHGTGFFGGVKDLSDVIGAMSDVTVEGNDMVATLRFADTPDVDNIWRKIQTGILKNISVGYRVYKYEDVTPKDVIEPKTLKAIDWEVFESSVVAIPADYTAQMKSRSAEQNQECLNDVEIETDVEDEVESEAPVTEPQKEISAQAPEETKKEIFKMNEEELKKQAALEAQKLEDAKKEATANELARGVEIRKAVKAAKLEDSFAEKLIADGVTIDAARASVIDELAKNQPDIKSQNPTITMVRDEDDAFKKGAVEAILHRAQPGKFKLTEAARPYAYMTMKELARLTLERKGHRTGGLGPMDLVTKAFHTSSDFSALLADSVNKTLRSAYELAPNTFEPWARRGTAKDFKTMTRLNVGIFPAMTKVLEHGEFEYKTFTAGGETYQIATYGGIVAITRQAIVNDDMSAFDRIAESAGASAKALENDIVYGVLTANAALADGVALFHATHGNLMTSAAISVASLGLARAAMRKQKANGRVLNLRPKYLLVPAALETIAQQFIASTINPNQASETNPFVNSLTVIVDPRLDDVSGTAWYLVADPAMVDTIEYSYLEGNEGVYTEVHQGFKIDGVEIKARHDFGAKAIDYRGMIKNAGV